ncbi:MAG: DUF6311 domain-containing protein [Oscillospiraceae bacterium]|nr:DUF6311 domain-containing protein [Oscillospiraceae bacterium]
MTKNKKHIAILLAALIGIAAFFISNDALTLNVTNDNYILGGYIERDIIQHYTGWLFYRESHLTLPLGVSPLISYPTGGSIAFSDSIPVFSVFCDLFEFILPDTFQFFGIYTLLCYILMGISSALLLCLFFDRILPVAIGCLLFVFSPVMLERTFRHTALASHFLVIFTLYLYFSNRKEGFRYRYGYLLLCFFAVGIHFYFVPLVLSVLFADLLQNCLKSKKVLSNLLFLALNILTVILTAILFGYFYTDTAPGGVLGYGYFTMNLNSLFNPVSKGGIVWSLLLPPLGQGLGSAEGFNYLGLGILVALVLLIVWYCSSRRYVKILVYLKSHVSLAIVSLLLSLFAVSTTVIINNNAYLQLQLPPTLLQLFSVFRSSGRLFWVVYYLLILFVLVSLRNALPSKLLPILLSALTVIQLVDMLPAVIQKHNAINDSSLGFDNPTNLSFFIENTDSYNEIFTVSDNGIPLGLCFANYAVGNNMRINEPFMARNDLASYTKGKESEYARLMNGEIAYSTLYIFNDVNRFFDAAVLLEDSAVSFILPFEDIIYYIIAPHNSKLSLPNKEEAVLLEDIPLTVADYSDRIWTNGVLNDYPNVVSFYDNAFTKQYLEHAEYIICDGEKFKIKKKDYHDPGWVMVTLEIEDATLLLGKPLSVA